jgi:hypothetical protein
MRTDSRVIHVRYPNIVGQIIDVLKMRTTKHMFWSMQQFRSFEPIRMQRQTLKKFEVDISCHRLNDGWVSCPKQFIARSPAFRYIFHSCLKQICKTKLKDLSVLMMHSTRLHLGPSDEIGFEEHGRV